MSKILINQTASDIFLVDTGVTVLTATPYTIPPEDYSRFAASSDVIKAISSDPAQLVLNDGGNDITSVSNAVDIIKGWPVQVDTSSSQVPFFFDFSDVVSGGSPVILLSITVNFGETLALNRLEISCRIESLIQVTKNGEVIADLRTGAAQPSSSFLWYPGRDCLAGEVIEVVLTKRSGTSDISVGAHLSGVITTT